MSLKPCWETNPQLWGEYSDVYKDVTGIRPYIEYTEEEVAEKLPRLYEELSDMLRFQRMNPSCAQSNPKLWKTFRTIREKRGDDAYEFSDWSESDVKDWLSVNGFTQFLPRKGTGWVFVPAK